MNIVSYCRRVMSVMTKAYIVTQSLTLWNICMCVSQACLQGIVAYDLAIYLRYFIKVKHWFSTSFWKSKSHNLPTRSQLPAHLPPSLMVSPYTPASHHWWQSWYQWPSMATSDHFEKSCGTTVCTHDRTNEGKQCFLLNIWNPSTTIFYITHNGSSNWAP